MGYLTKILVILDFQMDIRFTNVFFYLSSWENFEDILVFVFNNCVSIFEVNHYNNYYKIKKTSKCNYIYVSLGYLKKKNIKKM